MLIRSDVLDGIRRGQITLAFRRWDRPTVRTGGTLLTPAGQLRIGTVSPVQEDAVTEEDAHRAGYESRGTLLKELNRRSSGEIYRIEFGELLPDPRLQLRGSIPDAAEVGLIVLRLARLDRSADEPWTRQVFQAVAEYPGLRAAELARRTHRDTETLKRNVRKLKNLGLTISMGTGYRLSPRGEIVFASLMGGDPNPRA